MEELRQVIGQCCEFSVQEIKQQNFNIKYFLLLGNIIITTMLSTKKTHDRFIPNHNHDHSQFSFHQTKNDSNTTSYNQYIKSNMLNSSRVLQYNNKDDISIASTRADLLSATDSKTCLSQRFQTKSSKALDAPNFRDDFYLNNIDWSKWGPLGIALDNQLYLYSPSYTLLVGKAHDELYYSSVKFLDSLLSVGLSDGAVELYDLEKNIKIRQIFEHSKRVATQQFAHNLLITGSKDRNIIINDLKMKRPVVKKFRQHKGQICSLTARKDLPVLASGGNDSNIFLWDLRQETNIQKLKGHTGAIKGLSWCPWRHGVLGSGGGNGDRTIRLWNTNQYKCFGAKKTPTQISGLVWNQSLELLFTSHGVPDNDIKFWKIRGQNDFQKQCELHGHKSRVLQMIQSPVEDYLCTVGSDESLRFWRLSQADDSKERSERWSFKLK